MTVEAVASLQIECPKCHGPVLIEVGPTRVFNTPEVGTSVITHDQEVDCPGCRTHLRIMLAGDFSRCQTFMPLSNPQSAKEQITEGGIVLPMTNQNKTVHEGVVLANPQSVTRRNNPLLRRNFHGAKHIARRESEEIVDQLAQELYATSGRLFSPMFPWVFVRVLPKEQITEGGIVLPMTNQNKTVHEGIVLATWKPIAQTALPRKQDDGTNWRASVSTRYRNAPEESELKPGDHVLFPHWAGLPVEGFSDKHYRVVKETAWLATEEGGIFATVDYSGAAERCLSQLHVMLSEFESQLPIQSDPQETVEELIKRINEKFVLVERGGYSVTLSGR